MVGGRGVVANGARRSARELRGLQRSPLAAPEAAAPAGSPEPEQGLVAALAGVRRELREANAQAAPQGGDRTVNITNRITLEQRPGEDLESYADRLLEILQRRQALAAREALADAY